MNDARLRSDVIHDEGYRSELYRCTAGKWSVGYGRNVSFRPLRDVTPLRTIGALLDMLTDPDNHERWLDEDLLTAEIGARRYLGDKVFDSLTDARQEILVNMAYTLGGKGLAGFVNLKAAILAGHWVKAEAAILDSAWARDAHTGARARRLASRFLEG